MARKVYLKVTLPLILTMDEETTLEEVMDTLCIEPLLSPIVNASVEDSGPFEWEVTDSK